MNNKSVWLHKLPEIINKPKHIPVSDADYKKLTYAIDKQNRKNEKRWKYSYTGNAAIVTRVE